MSTEFTPKDTPLAPGRCRNCGRQKGEGRCPKCKFPFSEPPEKPAGDPPVEPAEEPEGADMIRFEPSIIAAQWACGRKACANKADGYAVVELQDRRGAWKTKRLMRCRLCAERMRKLNLPGAKP